MHLLLIGVLVGFVCHPVIVLLVKKLKELVTKM